MNRIVDGSISEGVLIKLTKIVREGDQEKNRVVYINAASIAWIESNGDENRIGDDTIIYFNNGRNITVMESTRSIALAMRGRTGDNPYDHR